MSTPPCCVAKPSDSDRLATHLADRALLDAGVGFERRGAGAVERPARSRSSRSQRVLTLSLDSMTTLIRMRRFAVAPAVLALFALAAVPAGAQARAKPRLVALEDQAPATTSFDDRVLRNAPATAAQA